MIRLSDLCRPVGTDESVWIEGRGLRWQTSRERRLLANSVEKLLVGRGFEA